MQIVNFGHFKNVNATGILHYENEDGRDWYEMRRGLTEWGPSGEFVSAVYGAWAMVNPDTLTITNVEYDPSRLVPDNKIVLGIDADWQSIQPGMSYRDGAIIEAPPPTMEELRTKMPRLPKWRIDTIIDLEPGLRDKINAAIEVMPEPNRTISKNKLASVVEFSRTDSLFELIGSDLSIGKSPEDIDAMWEAAAALK